VLNFDVPVCGRIAILTNQSSAVSLCTSQFKYPLRFKYPLKYSKLHARTVLVARDDRFKAMQNLPDLPKS